MKKILTLLTLIPFLVAPALAGEKTNTNDRGIAVQGYDVVALYEMQKPIEGDQAITVEHQGATYQFSNKENQAKFQAEPAKYAPAFGGYCAYGVAKGALFPVDVTTAQVVNGRLVLNKNPDVQKLFNEDASGFVKEADTNWKKVGKE